MKYILKPAMVFIMVGFILSNLYAQEVIVKEDARGITHIRVSNLADLSSELDITSLKIRLENSTQSILGHYSVQNGRVEFRPYWPLDKQLTYEIIWKDSLIETIRARNIRGKSKTEVRAIYPNVDILPENLLKLYIQFSGSMSEGQSARFVTLLKNDVDTVHRAFLDLQPELWNRDRSTLTLWMEPGRVKRDLGPNRILGQALKSGESYSLIISEHWKDASGVKLTNDYVKKFKVAKADRASPDIRKWIVNSPKPETKQTLHIDFNETLDFILAKEVIQITLDDKLVNGEVSVSPDGRQWSLKPYDTWYSGKYAIKVETKLEDMAGNNLNRLFDTDLKTTDQKRMSKARYDVIYFSID